MYVNAVGADRTGIVSDMTKFVTDAGGNVGRSQAARLGDQFSLMMQIEVPTDKVQTLREQLQGMPGMNATIFEAKKMETNLTPNIACKKKSKEIPCMYFILSVRITHTHNFVFVCASNCKTLVNLSWRAPVILVSSTMLRRC